MQVCQLLAIGVPTTQLRPPSGLKLSIPFPDEPFCVNCAPSLWLESPSLLARAGVPLWPPPAAACLFSDQGLQNLESVPWTNLSSILFTILDHVSMLAGAGWGRVNTPVA